jgi:hypothetical protein
MGGDVGTVVLHGAPVVAARRRSLACRFCDSLIEVGDEPEGTLLECGSCGSVGALA